MQEHAKGSVFHTTGMHRGYLTAPGHRPLYLAARNAQGDILAVLGSVQVSVDARFSKWTSRSVMYAEPICRDSQEGVSGLSELLKIHDEHNARQTVFTEVRPLAAAGREREALEGVGYRYCDYFNYVQDLEEGMESLGKRAKKMKRKISTALNRGAEIHRLECTKETIEKVYPLIATSYCRARVPLAPLEMFRAVLESLPEAVPQIREMTYEGRRVAAAIGLVFKDRYFAWYNGTLRPPGISSAAVLVWDELQQACDLGLRYYDFGGAGWPNEDYGPRTFKSRFKGNLVNHGRYRKVNSRFKLNVAKCGYRLLRGAMAPKPVHGDG